MNYDGKEDFFLEQDDLKEHAMSTESSKKRKVEEGKKYSSLFYSVYHGVALVFGEVGALAS